MPGRRFGGVGLMIEKPIIELVATCAPAWSAQGPLADRSLQFAQRFRLAMSERLPEREFVPQALAIMGGAPEHSGLGTGTQLALAVCRSLVAAWGLPELSTTELARHMGRGARSALGIHGFDRGGFLVEAGKRQPESISPLVSHVAFPADWRIVLVLPQHDIGVSGMEEIQAFQRLEEVGVPSEMTDRLCRLILLGMLPALAEQDLLAFGEALYEYNHLAGAMFEAVQGGSYASPAIAEMVAFLRSTGIRGVGQSSWGPTVFAVVGSEAEAEALSGRVRRHFGLDPGEVWWTAAAPRGAILEKA